MLPGNPRHRNAVLLFCVMPLLSMAAQDLSRTVPRILQELAAGANETSISALHDLADANDPHAELALYVIYDQGIGTAPSPRNALLWLRRAADHDIAEAQAELADRYYAGRGLPRDAGLALGWWRRAATQGYAPAQFNLAAVLRGGSEREVAEAATWLQAAATAAYGPALAALGEATAPPLAVVEPTRMADTPRDRQWVLAQNPDAYTIHVATGDEPTALATMLAAHLKGQLTAIAAVEIGSEPQFIALYGAFADRDTALAALAEIPAALRFNAPRVRRFSVIHELLWSAPQ